MFYRRHFFLCFVFLSYMPVFAQVDTAWVRRYDGPYHSDDWARDLAVDDSGNVYVTGESSPGFAVIKYAPNGDTLWVRRGEGGATALVVDNQGSVYVAGTAQGVGTFSDYVTIKYGPDGETLWVRYYNGPSDTSDEAYALALDSSGSVYVTGASTGNGTGSDIATLKYTANGDNLWVRRYNGPRNGNDVPVALAVDDSGNIYVAGWSRGSSFSADFVTIKYAPNGDTAWARYYDSGLGYSDGARGLALDGSGNVYVTGSLEIDTGLITHDWAIIKYAPNGDTEWVRRYNGPADSVDIALALAVDGSGNVLVTGFIMGGGTISDYAIIKYAPNGDTLWIKRYDGTANGDDGAVDLEVDDSGNVYVTGYSVGSGTFYDYTTIKYSPNGDTLWVSRYNGLADSGYIPYDYATKIVVDKDKNVYVTGGSGYTSNPSEDFATIKYVQYACTSQPGDVNGDEKVNIVDIVFSVNYMFKDGVAPSLICSVDDNSDGKVDLLDVVYKVSYIFKDGPAPLKSKECCL